MSSAFSTSPWLEVRLGEALSQTRKEVLAYEAIWRFFTSAFLQMPADGHKNQYWSG